MNEIPSIPSEGRFRLSRKNEDCPNPWLWHSRSASATEVEVAEFIAALVRLLQPEIVVETGCYKGFTSELIGKALVQNGHGRLIGLDCDAKLARQASRRCEDLPVDIVCIDALKWKSPQGQPIDFVFFDSSLDNRVPEFRAFHKWMTSRTIVAFHDTGMQHPLRPEIERLAADGLIVPVFLPTPRGLCVARVLR